MNIYTYIYVCPFFYWRKFIDHGFIPLSRDPFYSVPLIILKVSRWQRSGLLCSFSHINNLLGGAPSRPQLSETPRMNTSWFKLHTSSTPRICKCVWTQQLTHTHTHSVSTGKWTSVRFVNLALFPSSGHTCTSLSLETAPP